MNKPLICMTLTGKSLEEDMMLTNKYEKVIDLVELRVDHLSEDEQLYARRFPSLVNKPCLLTIRRDVDGGLFKGGEFSRTNLFARALAFANTDRSKNFAYVDFEEDFQIPSIQDAAMAFGVRIIRSCHNMKEPITNLRERCNQMRKTGYEIPKIAFMPKTLADLSNMFREGERLTQYEHIFVAMGPEGLSSRILAFRSNSFLTFVSPEEMLMNTTSIGHLDPNTLINLYHFNSLSKTTSLYGITGWPLKKLYSPQLFNDAFKKNKLDAVYLPIQSSYVSESLSFAPELDFKGLSITVPYRESVLYYLHEQTPEVIQIGAANTLVRKNNKWIGYNTDYIGFTQALEEFMGGIRIKRLKVAVLGAGGAAKAVVYALKLLGARVCIFNRTIEHAQLLAEKYGYEYAQLDSYSVEKLDEYSSLIIQCTSLGMSSSQNDECSSENDPIYFYNFRGNELLFDLVTTPQVTPLMNRAKIAGCRVCNGFKMLEYQTQAQFKIFTGREM